MQQNDFTRKFKLTAPVIQGPMGGVSGPNLVAAIANSGGLGVLPVWAEPLQSAVEAMTQVQKLTDRAFAINLRADLRQLDHISAALDTGIKIFHLFWGNPSNSMSTLNSTDALMIATVSDTQSTKAALDAGAALLIAQGAEAGGHVLSEIPVQELLISVIELAGNVPVVAAGSCVSGADIRNFEQHGASGVLMGTRFAASLESDAHEDYKQALVNAGDGDTVRTLCFDGRWPDAPHRVLSNSTTKIWEQAGKPAVGRPGEGDIVLHTAQGSDIPRYHVTPPKQGMSGDICAAAMYAGLGVAKIKDCPSVAEIFENLRLEYSQAAKL